jgi:hemerythrin-like domain-containing protein
MIHAHNDMIRGLNSIVLQGPHVPDASEHEQYNAQDVKDLLFYVEAWTKAVDHHHHIEETVLFPALAKLSDAAKKLVEGPVEQHAAFHDGLVTLQRYAVEASNQPETYRWDKMRTIIDSLASNLLDHLNTEPYLLLELERDCESVAVEKCMVETERAAVNDVSLNMLYDIFPVVLGSADKTYEGGNSWPALPPFMPFLMNWWFSRRRKGAWRFSPCDLYGQPVPLKFLPQNPESS